jgi:hypothetical protein
VNSRCTLRISSETVPLAAIVSAMNAEPTRGYEASDPIGRTDPRPRGRALACFESSLPRAAPLHEHIEELVEVVRARAGAIAALRETCDIDLFCMVSSENGQGSCILEPALMADLGTVGLPLCLDPYPLSTAGRLRIH